MLRDLQAGSVRACPQSKSERKSEREGVGGERAWGGRGRGGGERRPQSELEYASSECGHTCGHVDTQKKKRTKHSVCSGPPANLKKKKRIAISLGFVCSELTQSKTSKPNAMPVPAAHTHPQYIYTYRVCTHTHAHTH
jgi:hypothetical protein